MCVDVPFKGLICQLSVEPTRKKTDQFSNWAGGSELRVDDGEFI